MRPASIAIAILLAMAAGGVAGAAELKRPRGVIELFTSQGCSSCPPADRVLAEIAAKGEVLALGWHIDYWDYLGWKDTFGLAKATKRQKAYSASLGTPGVYTPQAIVNGQVDVVGSRGQEVMEVLDRLAGPSAGLPVPITANEEAGILRISVQPGADATGSMLWMVYFDEKRTVTPKAGENRGHALEYTNVVRDMEMIGMVGDEPLQAAFPVADLAGRGYEGCALVLQKKKAGKPGAIVGALMINGLAR